MNKEEIMASAMRMVDQIVNRPTPKGRVVDKPAHGSSVSEYITFRRPAEQLVIIE